MTVCPNINCVDISEGALQGTQSKSMIQHFIQILYKALSMEEAKVPIALTVLSINRGGVGGGYPALPADTEQEVDRSQSITGLTHRQAAIHTHSY